MGDAISGAFDFFGGAADTAAGAVSDVGTGIADAASALATGVGNIFAAGDTAAGTAALNAPVGVDVTGGVAPIAATAGSSLPAAVSPAASQELDQNIIQEVAGAGPSGAGATPLGGPIVSPLGDTSSGAATTGMTASDLLKGPATVANDPLQAELTAAGINATGSNAAQVGTVDAALGPQTSGGGGGFLKSATDFLGTPAGKLGVAALPLAATLLRGEPSLPPQFKDLGAVTGPLSATARTQLAAANAGQLTPGAAATVAQYVQGATNQLYQNLANEGVTDPRSDSRWISGQQQIQQQASVMTEQFIQDEFKTAFAAAGGASNNLIAAAEAQIQEDQAFNQALSAAFTSFGLLSFLQNKAAA